MISEGTDNKTKLWGIAAIVGVVAFLLLKIVVNYAFWPALLLAILIGILVAILLWIGFYRDAGEEATLDAKVAANTVAPPTAAANAPTAAVTTEAATPAAEKPATKAKAKPKPKAKPASAKSPAKKTAAKKTPAKKPAAKKPAAKPRKAAKDGKPALLKKARAGGADDLKVIKGVGPGLEKTLNEMGFYHYDQIAGWGKQDIGWVDDRLKFKGRIVRDGWVKQAKSLAKG